MRDVNGKTALVTGASRGIGRAVSETLASHGARIALHYRRERAEAEQVRQELHGKGHILVQAELMDPVQTESMVSEVARQFGTIDILVNNAGIFDLHPLKDMTYESWQEAWRKTIGTNLLGAANTSYCVIRHMQKTGG